MSDVSDPDLNPMTYRLLDVDTEWPLLVEDFAKRGYLMPSPQFAMIVGAFNQVGQLQGYVVVRMQVHMEPLVVYTPLALRGLINKGEEEIRARFGNDLTYFTFASGRVGDIAETFGAVRLPTNVYAKQLSSIEGVPI